MKAKTCKVYKVPNEDGGFDTIEQHSDTVFDVNEIFCFTTINDEETGEPILIELLTKNNVQCTLVYDPDVIIGLAQNFRQRGAL